MWRPNTLLEAIDSGEDIKALGVRFKGRNVLCPNCGITRPPVCLVDVRALPIPEAWACDACWTRWEREGRVVDGGSVFERPEMTDKVRGYREHKREWRRRWVQAHGAPADVVSRFQARGD